jgi:HSP20 family molecular chaperone IbpA
MSLLPAIFRSPSSSLLDSVFVSPRDDYFDRLSGKLFSDVWNWQSNDNDYTLIIDIPGFEENEINVAVENNILSISAKSSQHARRAVYYVASLPANTNSDNVEATLKNGVLTIRAVKNQKAQARQIIVNSADSTQSLPSSTSLSSSE